LSDEALQRSRQVRLVEISRFINRLRDRRTPLQKNGCMPRALDLTHSALREARRTQEVALGGAR